MPLKLPPTLPKMMPKDFLYQLPDAPNVTDGDNCPICLEEYVPTEAPAPGIIACLWSMVFGPAVEEQPSGSECEHAVRLPCQHVIGVKCMERWVSPIEGAQNTCPHCVQPLFQPSRYPVSTHPLWDPLIDVLGRYGISMDRNGVFGFEPERATTLPSPQDLSSTASLLKANAAFYKRHCHLTPGNEYDVRKLAAARLTRHLQEAVLYLQLQVWGARLPAIEERRLGDSYPFFRLGKRREDAMFECFEGKPLFDVSTRSSRPTERGDIENSRRLGVIPQTTWRDAW